MLAGLFLLIALLGLIATPAFAFLGSVYPVGGRSPFRPLGGTTIADLEQEAAGRLHDYRAQLAGSICAIVGAGAAFAALGIVAPDQRIFWGAVGLGIAAISWIPWGNIRSSDLDFGVLLEIERRALMQQRTFGDVSNHLLFQRPDLAKTITKLQTLRALSDERERKTVEALLNAITPPARDAQGEDAALPQA